MEDEREEEIAGTDGEDRDVPGQYDEDSQSSDEATSPPPTNVVRRLRQEPRISFVFDDATGDFVESYPTIFLPRPAIPPVSSQGFRCSVCSNTSPVNRNAAYLKTVQSSKPDTKKKKKDPRSKDKAPDVAVPRKRTRDDNEGSQAVDNPAAKKLKSKDIKTADDKGV